MTDVNGENPGGTGGDGGDKVNSKVYHRTSVENAAQIFDDGGFDPNKSKHDGYTYFSTKDNKGAGKKVASSTNVVLEGTIDLSDAHTISKTKMTEFFNEGFKRANSTLGTNYASMSEVPKALKPQYQSIADGIRNNELIPEYMNKVGKEAYIIEGKNTVVLSKEGIKRFNFTRLKASIDQISKMNILRTPSETESLSASKQLGSSSKGGINFGKWGMRSIALVGIGFDLYDIYNSEDKLTEVTRKAYGWTGASIGASSFASAAAIGGQLGPQVATPEEIITVPLAGLIGGIVGYFAGQESHDVLKEHIFTPGIKYFNNQINNE